MTTKKRILKGISANLANSLLIVIIQIITVPVLIKFWGLQYYGEWIALITLPSYIAMSDLGLGVVANTEINILLAQNNEIEAKKIFNQSFNLMLKVGLLPFFILIILVNIPIFYTTLNIQSISHKHFIITTVLLFLYGYWALVISLPLGLYRSIGQYARGVNISTIFRTLEMGIFLTAVWQGASMVMASLIFFLLRLLQSIYISIDLKKRCNVIDHSISKWDTNSINHIIKPSIAMIGLHLGQNFIVQGVVIVINVVLGGASVVVFSTTRTLCNFAKQMIGIINLSYFGEFTTAFASGDKILTKKLLKQAEWMVWTATFVSTLFLFFAGDLILKIWTQGQLVREEPFYTIFLFSIIFNSIWYIRYTFLLSTNQHTRLTIPYLLISILILYLLYTLLPIYGLWISATTLLIIDIIMIPLIFTTTKRSLNK